MKDFAAAKREFRYSVNTLNKQISAVDVEINNQNAELQKKQQQLHDGQRHEEKSSSTQTDDQAGEIDSNDQSDNTDSESSWTAMFYTTLDKVKTWYENPTSGSPNQEGDEHDIEEHIKKIQDEMELIKNNVAALSHVHVKLTEVYTDWCCVQYQLFSKVTRGEEFTANDASAVTVYTDILENKPKRDDLNDRLKVYFDIHKLYKNVFSSTEDKFVESFIVPLRNEFIELVERLRKILIRKECRELLFKQSSDLNSWLVSLEKLRTALNVESNDSNTCFVANLHQQIIETNNMKFKTFRGVVHYANAMQKILDIIQSGTADTATATDSLRVASEVMQQTFGGIEITKECWDKFIENYKAPNLVEQPDGYLSKYMQQWIELNNASDDENCTAALNAVFRHEREASNAQQVAEQTAQSGVSVNLSGLSAYANARNKLHLRGVGFWGKQHIGRAKALLKFLERPGISNLQKFVMVKYQLVQYEKYTDVEYEWKTLCGFLSDEGSEESTYKKEFGFDLLGELKSKNQQGSFYKLLQGLRAEYKIDAQVEALPQFKHVVTEEDCNDPGGSQLS